MIDYVSKSYHNLLQASGVKDISYWIAEDQPNNYPQHPVFQDNNSLVSIAFYKNEIEYNTVMNKLASNMNAEMRNNMRSVFTLHSHVILYNAK